MYNLYNHPATQFTCRHCGKSAGYDPEICFYCGPVCYECFMSPAPCAGEKKHQAAQEQKQQAKKVKA